MFDPAVREFLHKPLIARLATVGEEAAPHLVPLWFDVDDDDLIMISDRAAKKVKNIQRNPAATVTIGGEPEHGPAYMLQGTISIEEDPEKAVTRRLTYRYEPANEAERLLALWANDDLIVMRLRVHKVVKVY
jgi:PPOX class probable F420-dependent enzyme